MILHPQWLHATIPWHWYSPLGSIVSDSQAIYYPQMSILHDPRDRISNSEKIYMCIAVQVRGYI